MLVLHTLTISDPCCFAVFYRSTSQQLKDEIPNLQTRMASCAACQAGAAALAPDDAGGPAAKKRKADAKPTAHDSQAPAAAAASAAVPGQWDYRYCTHAEPVGSDRAAVGSPALASWLGKHLPEMLVYYANGEF